MTGLEAMRQGYDEARAVTEKKRQLEDRVAELERFQQHMSQMVTCLLLALGEQGIKVAPERTEDRT